MQTVSINRLPQSGKLPFAALLSLVNLVNSVVFVFWSSTNARGAFEVYARGTFYIHAKNLQQKVSHYG